MSVHQYVAVVGGLVLTAAFLRAAPTLWRAVKGFVAWADAQSQLVEIPAKIDALAEDLTAVKRTGHRLGVDVVGIRREVRESRRELSDHVEQEGSMVEEISRTVQSIDSKGDVRHGEFTAHVLDDARQFEDVLSRLPAKASDGPTTK